MKKLLKILLIYELILISIFFIGYFIYADSHQTPPITTCDMPFKDTNINLLNEESLLFENNTTNQLFPKELNISDY